MLHSAAKHLLRAGDQIQRKPVKLNHAQKANDYSCIFRPLVGLAELDLKSLQDFMKSSVESFGQNRLKIVAGNEKSRPWSNQDAKEEIYAKKLL